MKSTEREAYPGVAIVTRVAGVAVILLSLLGLCRWFLIAPDLQGAFPTAPAAKVNGLICGLCFGSILILITLRGASVLRALRILTGFIIFISTASLSQDIFSINLGIDELIVKDPTGSVHPGRIAVFASTGFLFVATALLLQSLQNRILRVIAKAMHNLVTFFCFFILLTYLYQVTHAHKVYADSIMSIPACIVLLSISACASLHEPETGLTSIFFGKKLGSQIARILFPLLIVTILAEGFGQILLSRFEGINEYFGVTLLLFAFILTCLGIVFFVTKRFNRLDDERNVAMQQLLLQNEELKQFAYITSHDLQEPLRTIQGYTRFLLKNTNDPAKSKLYIEGVKESAERMSSLVHALLHYNLLGRKREYQPVELNTLWNEVLHDINTSKEQTNAVITATTPLPVVTGTAQELRQLFQNLVSNGIKFRKTNEQPRIELSAQELKDEWMFSLKDNGIGIPAKYREKVFQLFQRLHGTDEYAGTGIGLSYCKKIVELHKGKIWIESADEGGSIFCFTISKNINHNAYA